MASISIEIDDILYILSSYEKQELADELYDDGYCPKELTKKVESTDIDWDMQVDKLIGNRWKLSSEDEETILRITNKLV